MKKYCVVINFISKNLKTAQPNNDNDCLMFQVKVAKVSNDNYNNNNNKYNSAYKVVVNRPFVLLMLLLIAVVIVVVSLFLLQQTLVLHTRMYIACELCIIHALLHTNMCCHWVEIVCGRLFKTTCVPDCIEWITKNRKKNKFPSNQNKNFLLCAFVLCLKGKFFFSRKLSCCLRLYGWPDKMGAHSSKDKLSRSYSDRYIHTQVIERERFGSFGKRAKGKFFISKKKKNFN